MAKLYQFEIEMLQKTKAIFLSDEAQLTPKCYSILSHLQRSQVKKEICSVLYCELVLETIIGVEDVELSSK